MENQKLKEFEDLEVWPSGPPEAFEAPLKNEEKVKERKEGEEGEEGEEEDAEEVEKNREEETSKKGIIDFQGEISLQDKISEDVSEVTEEKKEEGKDSEEIKERESDKAEIVETEVHEKPIEDHVEKKKKDEISGDTEDYSVEEILNEEN